MKKDRKEQSAGGTGHNKSIHLLRLHRIMVWTVMIISIIAALTIAHIIVAQNHRLNQEQTENTAEDLNFMISETLGRYMAMTASWNAVIQANQGMPDKAATENICSSMISDTNTTACILFAPQGVATYAYPTAGTDYLIGYHLLDNSNTAQYALLAKMRGETTLNGPVTDEEGRDALVILEPVYLDAAKTQFWGFVVLILKYPDIFQDMGMDQTDDGGYRYYVEMLNTDTKSYERVYGNTEEPLTNAVVKETSGDGYSIRLTMQSNKVGRRVLIACIYYLLAILIAIYVTMLMILFLRQRREKMQLQQEAVHDELTGILNRSGLKNRLAHVGHGMYYIALMDIDDFKLVNDVYSHDIGDLILKKYAACLKEVFGEDIVYRYGGDEFLIISMEKNQAIFEQKLVMFQLEFKEATEQDTREDLSTSIGYVYGETSNAETLKRMIHQADIQLYQVKQHEKGQISSAAYDPDLQNETEVLAGLAKQGRGTF